MTEEGFMGSMHEVHTYTVYLEYHIVCPLVRIGTLHPLSHKGGTHSAAVEGVVPILTTGEKA